MTSIRAGQRARQRAAEQATRGSCLVVSEDGDQLVNGYHPRGSERIAVEGRTPFCEAFAHAG